MSHFSSLSFVLQNLKSEIDNILIICSVQCAWPPKKSTIVRFTDQLSAGAGGETTKLLASDVWPLQQCEETGQLT